MMIRINATRHFLKTAKPLIRKYASFEEDYTNLISDIRNNPETGIDLGGGLRKIRMQIKSKGKGKSGGARVITYNVIISKNDRDIDLITIYDKADISSIDVKELMKLIKR